MQYSQASINDDVRKYVNKARILIHDPKTAPAILQSLMSGGDPIASVGHVTVMVMQRIDSASREAGIETKDSVKVIAAFAIIQMLCKIGEASRKFNLDPGQQQLALTAALQEYFKGEIAAKRIDPERFRQSMGQQLQSLPKPQLDATLQGIGDIGMAAKQHVMNKQGVAR